MCTSRLHRVVEGPEVEEPRGRRTVTVEDVDGTRHEVSLLALDGPAPVEGEWLVVHSGYAVGRADRVEAEAVARVLRAGFTDGAGAER